MSESVEDRGFSALCAMGTPKGDEAKWSLGVLGVSAAAVLGVAYWKGRSASKAETGKMMTRPRRDAQGEIVIDPQTGQPVMETVYVKRKYRGTKLSVDAKGQIVQETEGVVVSELDEECPICGKKMADYASHLKSDHGVDIIAEDDKPRRMPRKKELKQLLDEMTPRERALVEKVVFEESEAVEALRPERLSSELERSSGMTYQEDRASKQIGVAEKIIPLTQEELDAPIDLTDPSDPATKVLGYRLKIGKPRGDVDDLELEAAEALGEDPADFEVPLDLAEESLEEGGTTLRKLGVKNKKIRIPIYKVSQKDLMLLEQIPEAIVVRRRLMRPELGGEAKLQKMVRAAELVEELRLEAEAKRKRELIKKFWPDKDKAPDDAAPNWIVDRYHAYLDRQAEEVGRIRERMLGRGAGRYSAFDRDGKSLQSLEGALDLLYGKRRGETAASKDDEGNFIYGIVLEGPFRKKIPIEFKNLKDEAQAKVNHVLRGFRKQALRPEELAVLMRHDLDERATAKAIKDIRRLPIKSDELAKLRKAQKELASEMIASIAEDVENHQSISTETEAALRSPFGRKRAKGGPGLGFGQKKFKQIKTYQGS